MKEYIEYDSAGHPHKVRKREPVASPQATEMQTRILDAAYAQQKRMESEGTTPHIHECDHETEGEHVCRCVICGKHIGTPPSEGTTPQAVRPAQIAIHIFQQDWIPGFAAFHDDGCISETAKAHVVLNLGSFMSAIQTKDLDPKDLPYFVAESLMHEVIHVLEAWANVEFSEDRVEALLTKYREKYERATIWEYTGGEPHE